MNTSKKNKPSARSAVPSEGANKNEDDKKTIKEVIDRIAITLPGGSPFAIFSVACGGDNRIYVTGLNISNTDLYVGCLLFDGRVDTAFGDRGFSRLYNPPETSDPVRDAYFIDVTSEHLTLHVNIGRGGSPLNYVALYRLRLNGTMEATFGIDGVAVLNQLPVASKRNTEISSDVRESRRIPKPEEELANLRRLAQRPVNSAGDGRLRHRVTKAVAHRLANGEMFVIAYRGSTTKIFYLVKINEDGSLDTTFVEGVGYLELRATNVTDYTVAVDQQGRALVAYDDSVGSSVRCYLGDGGLDQTFGFEGRSELTYPGAYLLDPVIKVDALGDIYVGLSHIDSSFDERSGVVVKLTGNGFLDPAFNGSGSVFLRAPFTPYTLVDIDIDSQQRVVALGRTDAPGNNIRPIVSRCSASGIDDSFGDSGHLILDGLASPINVAVQGDLAIVIAANKRADAGITLSEIWRLGV